MKWSPAHQPGERRVIRKFLYLPLTLRVRKTFENETRWWEIR